MSPDSLNSRALGAQAALRRGPSSIVPGKEKTAFASSRNARAILAAMLVSCAPVALGDPPAKRVEIDKSIQVMRCYENDSLVFVTRVSTGRRGYETPSGQFYAGVKYRMHYSTRYNNAPMPYSVQFSANYFIHGYTDVPAWPASHGCVRVPLARSQGGGNPAAWFYGWVDSGTPIYVSGAWIGRRAPDAALSQRVALQSNVRAPKRPPFLLRLFGGIGKSR